VPPFLACGVTDSRIANQPIFGVVISTIEHLARDITDYPTSKLAFSVLVRMVSTWGGPDRVSEDQSQRSGALSNGHQQTKLEGFDQFMMTRFSPLCWAIPSNPNFDSKDAQGKQALSEAAVLQKTICMKVGSEYLAWLENTELSGMGMDRPARDEYLNALISMDVKTFQTYFKVGTTTASQRRASANGGQNLVQRSTSAASNSSINGVGY